MNSISVNELKQWIDSKKDFQLVDVREPYENDICTLNGILIPMNEVPNEFQQISKDKPVVVHCRSGKRSANVIHYLEQQHGYTNLYNLEGGILAWIEEIDPSMDTY
jgi:adenylyltransferase/sulfurtransferase